MCHSARLAQRNLPAKHKKTIKGLNDKKKAAKEDRNILEVFFSSKLRLSNEYFSEIPKTAILPEKGGKVRTTANIVKTVARERQKHKVSYLDDHAR